MMELRQLEYFEAVCRLKSFTKAAREVHVTQPTITTAIKNLENELCAVLVDREDCGVTMAGEVLMAHAEAVLNNVRSIRGCVAEAGCCSSQRLEVAIPPISCAKMYPLVLSSFAEKYPDVDVTVRDVCNADVVRLIDDGTIETGFIIKPDSLSESMEYAGLEDGTLKVLMSEKHRLAAKDAISFKDILGEKILMYKKGTSYTEYRILKEYQQRNIPIHFQQYFDNFSTIFDLVVQNYGVSFLLDTVSPALTHIPGIVTRPFETPLDYQMGLVWSGNSFLSHACRCFLDFVCETYKIRCCGG